jgi:hypothetical protein
MRSSELRSFPLLDGPSPCPSPRLAPGRGDFDLGSPLGHGIFGTQRKRPLAPRSEAKRGEGWGEGRSNHLERGGT